MRRHTNLVLVTFLAGTTVLATINTFFVKQTHVHPTAAPLRSAADAKRLPPSLHCLFSDFTHASVVVGFDFVVAFPKGAPPQFAERAEAVRNDPEVDFDAGHQPVWSYAIDEGAPTIISPTGETRIVLYGLKLNVHDVFWIEAGIRSNEFRNLDGRCLQAHFP